MATATHCYGVLRLLLSPREGKREHQQRELLSTT
jgi:hypothetical protein